MRYDLDQMKDLTGDVAFSVNNVVKTFHRETMGHDREGNEIADFTRDNG